MPTLADIAANLPGSRIHGDTSASPSGMTHDSRRVCRGDLFAVVAGSQTDGRLYAAQAIAKGASALLVERAGDEPVPQLVVTDVRAVMGKVAALILGDPTAHLRLIGVTGTNGKTTTTYLVEGALARTGARPGVMGTVEYRFANRRWPAENTTPEAPMVQAIAREMLDHGATHLVMEASSHGLKLGRVSGCRFRVVAFTNLTQDHLDFHGDMADYAASKLRLFTALIADEPAARAVVNLDDPFGATILQHLRHPALTFSLQEDSVATLHPAGPVRYGITGLEALITVPGGVVPLCSPLLGPHNLANLLTALGICLALDLDAADVVHALGEIVAVPGRLERVSTDEPFAVLVDYAHTPDALERALAALRPLTRGRLWCVFGCGGDRDPGKRPLMGRAVNDGADLALVTSDNPRTEAPAEIAAMILPGLTTPRLPLESLGAACSGHAVELDRRRAIAAAIAAAAPDDTVLIAGKGHEDYQILGREKIHFDDREQARAALIARKERAHG